MEKETNPEKMMENVIHTVSQMMGRRDVKIAGLFKTIPHAREALATAFRDEMRKKGVSSESTLCNLVDQIAALDAALRNKA